MEPSNSQARPHILVVDDDPGVRDADALRLRRLGYETTVCEDGLRALALLDRNPGTFDLLLVDQEMPGLGGLDLAARISDREVNIPVVIMSGYSSDLTPENISSAKVEAVLMKPFNTDDMRSVLAAAIHS